MVLKYMINDVPLYGYTVAANLGIVAILYA